MSLFSELKRRNVFRVGAAYVVVAWLLIQVTETIFPLFGFDETPARIMVVIMGIGFIPTLVLSWVFEWTPEGLVRENEIDRSRPKLTAATKRLDQSIMLVLVLALGYFAFDNFILDPQREVDLERQNALAVEQARQQGRSEALTESLGDKSLAVLPFDNRSHDAEQDFFADGLTDELTATLARIGALKVIARTSTAGYKGTKKRASQIGDELNVNSLVTGSVLRFDGRVRITSELVSVETERTLWADSYERDESDILALQAEVARAIAEAVEVRLSPADVARLENTRTVDPAAYEAYLRGRSLWNMRGKGAGYI